jgi:hypothetical protein
VALSTNSLNSAAGDAYLGIFDRLCPITTSGSKA